MNKKIKFNKKVELLFPDLIRALRKKGASLKDIGKWEFDYFIQSDEYSAEISHAGKGFKSFKKKLKKTFKFINKKLPKLFEDSSPYGTDNGYLSYCAGFKIPKKFLIYSDKEFRKGFPPQRFWSIDKLKKKDK